MLLDHPLRKAKAASKTDREERVATARIVFGSRLVGPARRSAIDQASTHVGGVLVPPRPAEPDNCCMSGCVNCVWDRYQTEVEDWASKRSLARAEMQKQAGGDLRESGLEPGTGLDSADGSDDPFEGIPIGILEFMKTEKALRKKHAA